MPRNGSGSYSLPSGNPVVTGTAISSTVQNNTMSDIATALTASIAKDGQTTPTANLPMGGFKHTGAANGSAATDYATISNLQNGTGIHVSTVGGTSDVITLTPSPAITSYAAGQYFSFVSSGANTTNVTVNVSGLGAKAVTKNGSTALVAGDVPSGALVAIIYDGTQFQLQTSANLNPLSSITGLGTGVATALAINVGSAGAPVVLNGALGTPTSGDITNLAASQAQQETATALTVAVTPARQQYHPSASKAWIVCDFAGSIASSYNVTSITDGGAGLLTVTWNVDFSSANYCVIANIESDSPWIATTDSGTRLAGSCGFISQDASGVDGDGSAWHICAFGDQ